MEHKMIKPVLLLIIIVGVVYGRLVNGFFQQDEWFSYSWYILHKDLNFIDSLKFFFAPSIGHYNPLTNLLQHNLFSLMGMNYEGFALIGIFLHLLVVGTFYYFAKILFPKNKLIPFISILIFGLLASTYQGVSWVVANMSTLIATFLGIVSAWFYITYLKHSHLKHLAWALITLIVSLMFKEITIGLFILYFIYVVFNRNKNWDFRSLLLISCFGLSYIILRVAMFFLPNTTGDTLVTSSQSINNILYNLITIPLKSIAQIIFPPDLIKYFIKLFYKLISIVPNDLTVDKIISYLSMIIGLAIVLYTLYIIRKIKDNNIKFTITFGIIWAIVNSFIFAISPESSGTQVVVDSRNLYFSSIGVIIVLVSIIYYLFGQNSKKFILILASILLLNLYFLVNNLNVVINQGKERKYILNQIKSSYKTLPQKTIFLIDSNSSYYGLPDNEKIPPFQSGLGQTLLIWYYQVENFPKSFFENRFLWDIKSQGYKEDENRGFGYFRDYQKLKSEVNKNKLGLESIIAFSWDHNTKSLIEITEEVRNKLKNENN